MPNSAGPLSERKYRVIASDLRAAIARGEYPAQARLPGENDLMRQYQVARMTARQALAQLINEGLAVARKGSGVYVREFRPVIRAGVGRLSGARLGLRAVDLVGRHRRPRAGRGPARGAPGRAARAHPAAARPARRSRGRRSSPAAAGTCWTASRCCWPCPTSRPQIAAGTMMEYQDAGPGRHLRPAARAGPRAGPVPRGPALPDARARGGRAGWRCRRARRSWTSCARPTPPTGRSWRSTR